MRGADTATGVLFPADRSCFASHRYPHDSIYTLSQFGAIASIQLRLTMAFLVAAGIRFAVKGVQSGIQAHKDFNSDTPPEVPRDRWGHPKDRHPVYGLVMKAESRMKGGKGKDRDEGSEDHASGEGSSGQARQSNKQEHESENYGPQTYGSKEYSVSVSDFVNSIGRPL